MLVHGSSWEEIFEDRSQFWPYDLLGQFVGDKFRKIMDFSVLIVKMFWIRRNNIVMKVCTLENIFYMELLFPVGVFDGFYLLMCMNLKIQFALLSKAVHSMQLGTSPTRTHEEVCLQKLKQYIRYHQFLLK
jgi:hypothetical protein